ncbi:hypothetical protein EVAR_10093_1 [Eumeta japonica]|uniref:Uncharacterized protein n=1 Tax=Eumeta variegata TaxID=151549 RepID=A0A4C1UDE6_EUMVA|nr:hypothetical protein EVAR_10093_1 [Eumeta japonica]
MPEKKESSPSNFTTRSLLRFASIGARNEGAPQRRARAITQLIALLYAAAIRRRGVPFWDVENDDALATPIGLRELQKYERPPSPQHAVATYTRCRRACLALVRDFVTYNNTICHLSLVTPSPHHGPTPAHAARAFFSYKLLIAQLSKFGRESFIILLSSNITENVGDFEFETVFVLSELEKMIAQTMPEVLGLSCKPIERSVYLKVSYKYRKGSFLSYCNKAPKSGIEVGVTRSADFIIQKAPRGARGAAGGCTAPILPAFLDPGIDRRRSLNCDLWPHGKISIPPRKLNSELSVSVPRRARSRSAISPPHNVPRDPPPGADKRVGIPLSGPGPPAGLGMSNSGINVI